MSCHNISHYDVVVIASIIRLCGSVCPGALVYMHVCINLCTGMYRHAMCTDMRADIRTALRLDMCIDMPGLVRTFPSF